MRGSDSESDKASVSEILTIAERVATRVQRPYADHAELLYNEDGVPR